MLICDAAVGGCEHEDDFFVIIYFTKKAVSADSIAPGVWIETLQFLDIWSEVWMLTQLRVNIFAKFLRHFGLAGAANMAQVFLKLFGFKNPVFTQRSALSGDEPPANPSRYVS